MSTKKKERWLGSWTGPKLNLVEMTMAMDERIRRRTKLARKQRRYVFQNIPGIYEASDMDHVPAGRQQEIAAVSAC